MVLKDWRLETGLSLAPTRTPHISAGHGQNGDRGADQAIAGAWVGVTTKGKS